MSEHISTVMDVLQSRRAYRAFSDKPLDKVVLRSLLDAGRLAPSAFNEQPWRYLVTTADDPEPFGRMLGSLNELNRKWASKAQALVACVAKAATGAKNTPNRWSWHDMGLSLAHVMIAAAAHDVIAHPMAGFSVEALRQAFPDISEGYDPVTVVALGYHGDPSDLEVERHREAETAPRQRLDLGAVAFAGEWGKAF